MSQLQSIIATFVLICAIWFLILMLSEIHKEKMWRRQKERLKNFDVSQKKKRSTNKKVN